MQKSGKDQNGEHLEVYAKDLLRLTIIHCFSFWSSQTDGQTYLQLKKYLKACI
jgi:hypothetical protein